MKLYNKSNKFTQDVVCDKCKKSCKVRDLFGYHFEYSSFKLKLTETRDICEQCIDIILDFIDGK